MNPTLPAPAAAAGALMLSVRARDDNAPAVKAPALP